MDNSIRKKKLQIVNGTLRKRDEGLRLFFLFQKGCFWVRKGGWGNSTPFQRRFFLRDWNGLIFLGWGLTQKVVSWKGKVWLFFKARRWDFFNFPRIILLVVWDGVFGENRWILFFLSFFLL